MVHRMLLATDCFWVSIITVDDKTSFPIVVSDAPIEFVATLRVGAVSMILPLFLR